MRTMTIPWFTAETVLHHTGTRYQQWGRRPPLSPPEVVQPAAEAECQSVGDWSVCCGWSTCCAINRADFRSLCFDNPATFVRV